MSDKTLLIVALGVGAFLLTRRSVAATTGSTSTPAQRLFANQTQSAGRAGINPAIYGNNQAQMFGQVGGIIRNLFGLASTSGGNSGPSLTGAEYSAFGNSPAMRAEGIGYTGNGNVYDQAGASVGAGGFSYGLNDSMAGNPAPQFGSIYDAAGNFAMGDGNLPEYLYR